MPDLNIADYVILTLCAIEGVLLLVLVIAKGADMYNAWCYKHNRGMYYLGKDHKHYEEELDNGRM